MNRSIMFATILVLGTVSNLLASSIPVANPGFEVVQTVSDNAVPLGVWFGNLADMVTAENGVTPTDGSRMLKYLEPSNTSNLRQAIDVSALPSGIEVALSADVFRLAGTPNNSNFQLAFAAIDHSQSTFGNADFDANALGRLTQSIPENVWTTISFSTIVPPGTAILAVEVSYQSQGVIPGGYADNVRLTSNQVPEPSSIVLAALGLGGFVAWGWRRKRT